MYSQKIGNALRSIETWYQAADDNPLPIAIEPCGMVTHLGKVFEDPKDKQNFYTLFKRWVNKGSLSGEEEHYVVAVINAWMCMCLKVKRRKGQVMMNCYQEETLIT